MALRAVLPRHYGKTLTLTSPGSSSERATLSSAYRCSQQRKNPPAAAPPSPKKVPFRVSLHGKTWEDPYHWMSNTDDPNLLDHLRRENSYADAFMADALPLHSALAAEMKRRIPAAVSTPPERWGPWMYYQYIPEGKEYPVLCRKLEGEGSGWMAAFRRYGFARTRKEEILLDWNELAEKYGKVSPDHSYLAFTVDITGSERFMLQVKDLRTGFIDPKLAADGVVSLAWARDATSLFYTLSDENQRPYRQNLIIRLPFTP
ncbi:hypothetical protein PIB30_049758 [Stylosanthes scabra]|uniref:Peptidase S9A N-terminal domain-containing protein n=1 Tax=Stylosanthes scabra TaxID=79078 RepID=A0ABU6WFN3_9FABA|nr:hypothetical protein [Stylosanthes scabra]